MNNSIPSVIVISLSENNFSAINVPISDEGSYVSPEVLRKYTHDKLSIKYASV